MHCQALSDDVIINVPEDITVTHSGNSTIKSLQSFESLVLLSGTLDVAETLQVDNSFTLNGGTLKNATVVGGEGRAITAIANANNLLDGVTLNADLTLPSNGVVRIANDLELNGTVAFDHSGSLGFKGTQTLSGVGVILFPAAGVSDKGYLESAEDGTTLTIGPGITVHGGQGVIGGSFWFGRSMDVINEGTIIAETSGRTVSLTGRVQDGQGGHFTNQNVLQINGGILTLDADWTNVGGTIDFNVGTVNLGSTFNTAEVGTIDRGGGALNLVGTLDNTNDTLNLDAVGDLQLVGGVITGGTVAGASKLFAAANANNLLDGVTLNADLTLPTNGVVRIANDLELNATVTFDRSGSLGFKGTQTLSGVGAILFPTAGVSDKGYLESAEDGTTLTIGPGITVHGGQGVIGGSFWFGRSMDVINEGSIIAETSGRTVSLTGRVQDGQGGHFTNQNVLQINGGILTLDADWTNAGGMIDFNVGTVNLGSTFNTADVGTIDRGGGTLNLVGTLDNTSDTLNLDAVGDLQLVGGVITGGTVTGASKLFATTNVNNLLDGVTLNADLTLPFNGVVRIANDLELNGTVAFDRSGSLGFKGTQTLSGVGVILFPTTGVSDKGYLESAEDGTTLTIGPGITVHGGQGVIGGSFWFGRSMDVINEGTIIAETSGRTVSLTGRVQDGQGGIVTNLGTIWATGNGLLTTDNLNSNQGLISADAGSIVTVQGNFQQDHRRHYSTRNRRRLM